MLLYPLSLSVLIYKVGAVPPTLLWLLRKLSVIIYVKATGPSQAPVKCLSFHLCLNSSVVLHCPGKNPQSWHSLCECAHSERQLLSFQQICRAHDPQDRATTPSRTLRSFRGQIQSASPSLSNQCTPSPQLPSLPLCSSPRHNWGSPDTSRVFTNPSHFAQCTCRHHSKLSTNNIITKMGPSLHWNHFYSLHCVLYKLRSLYICALTSVHDCLMLDANSWKDLLPLAHNMTSVWRLSACNNLKP